MNLNELAKVIHTNNKQKGFYDEPKNIGEMLALIHSEVSEALEADRRNQYSKIPERIWEEIEEAPNDKKFRKMFQENCKDRFEDEMADVIIRVLDMCAYLEIDIQKHLKAKIEYNALRPHKHGKRY